MNPLDNGSVIGDIDVSTIKRQQCPSCGSGLTVDNDKQMYYCTFCGSTYDYEYFREENLHKLGDTSLAHGEFKAAGEAFKLILKKAPHDFHALRGMMLVAARLHNIDEIRNIDNPERFRYDPKIVREAVASASEDDKEYFAEFAGVYSDKKSLAELLGQIRSLKDDRERLESTIRLTDNSRYEYYFTTKNGSLQSPRSLFITMWCLAGMFVLVGLVPLFGLTAADLGDKGLAEFLGLFLGVTIIAIVIFNLVWVLPRVREVDYLDRHIRVLNSDLNKMRDDIRSLEADAEKLTDSISDSAQSFVKKDSLIEPDSVSKYGSGMSDVRKHQCPTCGGILILDEDTQMYHCAFCGSDYDYEYFREDQMHEAGEKYISRSEFKAAADAYEFTLKKDPHDFLALRGMMLAAARLSDMSELERVSEAAEFSYDSKVVGEVIAKAAEEDKEYFTEFGKVYSDRVRLDECAMEIRSLQEEKDKINSMIAKNNIDRGETYIVGKNGEQGSSKIAFVVLSIMTGIWTLIVSFFVCGLLEAIASAAEHTVFLGVMTFFHSAILIGLAAGTFAVLLPKVRKQKRIEADNTKLYEESGQVAEEIKALENRSDEYMRSLKMSIHDFVKKDRQVMSERMDI